MYDRDSRINTPGVGTREQWVTELRVRGADLPEQIVDAYIKYGNQIGYNYDLAIAQAIQECTGFTDWKWIELRNPAGIGSTSRSVPGDKFDSVEEGITAQYAHECAYAETADHCPIEKMDESMALLFNDPRHKFHTGDPRISAWNGHWAVPGTTYSDRIADIANKVVGTASAPPKEPPVIGPNIVDLRDILHRNPDGGPNYQDSDKVGAIWHYNGPPPNQDARTQYINDAVYHSNKDWGGGSLGDGIMYHYGIQSGDGGSDPDGTIYQLRDEDDVLWHCGAWVPGGNATGIAININIGEGENASAAALASAYWLGDELIRRRGLLSNLFKGHQEVSPTACPGTLMEDLVYPFRNGQHGGNYVPPTEDNFIHENGFIIGGGFKSVVDKLESQGHEFRLRFLGIVISNEGDGWLLSPETRDDGSTTGRYHVKAVVLQKFERQTLIHEADEANPAWQDVVPLTNRGFVAGFSDDPAIDAILKNKKAQV